MKQPQKLTWLIPVLTLVTVVICYYTVPPFQTFVEDGSEKLASGEEDQIRDWVEGFGGWGFAVVLALMLLQTVLPFLPSLGAMVVAVILYGPVLGGGLAWSGLVLAAMLGYAVGKLLGPVTIQALVSESTEQKMETLVHRHGVWGVIAARVSPVLSTDAVSIVAGLVGMGFWRFLSATAVGTLPLTVLVAWLGEDIDRMKSGLIWISVLSVIAFAVYVWMDHRQSSHK